MRNRLCRFDAAAPGRMVDLCIERGSLQVEEQCGWGAEVRGKDKILDLNVDKLDMPGGHLNGDVHFDFFGH